MVSKEISSLQHPIVKHLVKLRKSREYRKEHQSALITGIKLIGEIAPFSPLQQLIAELDYPLPSSLSAPTLLRVPHSLLKKITALENPEPLAAVVPLPPPAPLKGKKFLLVLDGIADPGNLGTLLRTALALGWEGAFLTTNTTDPFNEKALRAAKGATFRLPLAEVTWEELILFIQENRFQVLIADMQGEPLCSQDTHPPLLLVLGNESKGIKTAIRKRYPSVAIPMNSKMESLNVAIAGAILMHALKQKNSQEIPCL